MSSSARSTAARSTTSIPRNAGSRGRGDGYLEPISRLVEREFRGLLASLAEETGTAITCDWFFIRDAFHLDLTDPFVAAFQECYQAISGKALETGPKPFVDDGNSFCSLGKVPAITHGPSGRRSAHGRRVGRHRRPGARGAPVRGDRAGLLLDGRLNPRRRNHDGGGHTARPDQPTRNRPRKAFSARSSFATRWPNGRSTRWSWPGPRASITGTSRASAISTRISGIYVASVGHNNRRVIDAITAQFDVLAFSPPMHGTNPLAVRLANLLAELAPEDLSTVKFQTGGSEVTEAAIKLARQYHKLTGSPGKYKIISRYQSWHGSTLGALSASGLKSRRTVNEPLAPGFLHVFPPTCYRCPFGKSYPDCGITCATIVESVVEMEDPSTVAAIMVEPIGHTGGVIDPPDEYLPILREICDRHNILLIFDEIITGIGRTGRMFAAETFGVTPDVLCIAKGMSGGYAPISAMICRERIAEAFWGPIAENPGFVEGHTFEGNPISCAAGLAVLGEIIERDLCGNARAKGHGCASDSRAWRESTPRSATSAAKGSSRRSSW